MSKVEPDTRPGAPGILLVHFREYSQQDPRDFLQGPVSAPTHFAAPNPTSPLVWRHVPLTSMLLSLGSSDGDHMWGRRAGCATRVFLPSKPENQPLTISGTAWNCVYQCPQRERPGIETWSRVSGMGCLRDYKVPFNANECLHWRNCLWRGTSSALCWSCQ